jgi:hypothetical protein
MDIGRTDGVGGPGRIDGPNKIAKTTPPASTPGTTSADKLDLSQKAGMISRALGLPGVRADRVAEVRKLIESGRFDSDARLEGALDRFLIENPDL